MDKFKKKLLLLSIFIVIILALAGCGTKAPVKSSSYQAEYLPLEDFNFLSFNFLGESSRIVQSEEGYYFLTGTYLFFNDWNTGQTVPLCFKTNCLHTEESDSEKILSCDAFLGNRAAITHFLGYYQDKLYTICLDKNTANNNLVEINSDRSEIKILYSLSDDNFPTFIYMHRGVIYFVRNMKNLEGVSYYGLDALSVVSDSYEPVQIYTGTNEDGWIQNVLPYQNYIFFQDCYNTETSFSSSIIMYNIRTGESKELLKDSGTIYGIEDNGLLIRKGGLYYVYSLENQTLTPSQRNYNVFLQTHPQWQCHCQSLDEDIALFTCYDLEVDDFVKDTYVVNSQGEVAAIIPDTAWGVDSTFVFEKDGEKYIFQYLHNDSICTFAKNDLLRGIVNPITILDANDYSDLSPAPLIITGE